MMRNGSTRDTRPRSSYAAIYFALLAAAFAALNWHLSRTMLDTSPILPGDAAADVPVDATPPLPGAGPVALSLADLHETQARPLFRPNRRPPSSDPVTDTPQALPDVTAAADDLSLAGIMQRGNDQTRALIRMSGKPAGTWVGKGETVGNWRVSSIDRDRVLVESNGTVAELILFARKPATAPPAQPPQ